MMAEKTCVKVLVEENGEHGFDSYRVPGIVTASNGDLLLAYEGREAGGNRRTLFFRRYQIKDGQPQPAGERITMVSPKGEELLHNPLLIAAPEGRVYFFWCQDYQRLFLRESRDNGETFGEERELTSLIDGFRKEWPVTLWAIAPGHGICKKDGTLILPLWLSRGEMQHLPACFACLSSDDWVGRGTAAIRFQRRMESVIQPRAPWRSGATELCLPPCAMRSRECGEERSVRAEKRRKDRMRSGGEHHG